MQEFTVEFYTGTSNHPSKVKIMAIGYNEAKILAQAERIKAGVDYSVEHVWSKPK